MQWLERIRWVDGRSITVSANSIQNLKKKDSFWFSLFYIISCLNGYQHLSYGLDILRSIYLAVEHNEETARDQLGEELIGKIRQLSYGLKRELPRFEGECQAQLEVTKEILRFWNTGNANFNK